MDKQHLQRMAEGRARAKADRGNTPPTKRESVSLAAVRRNCMDCCSESPKAILWCTCDGNHSTKCEFWRHRFGKSPTVIAARFHPALVTPNLMPSERTNEDNLPNGLTEAADWLNNRNIPQV